MGHECPCESQRWNFTEQHRSLTNAIETCLWIFTSMLHWFTALCWTPYYIYRLLSPTATSCAPKIPGRLNMITASFNVTYGSCSDIKDRPCPPKTSTSSSYNPSAIAVSFPGTWYMSKSNSLRNSCHRPILPVASSLSASLTTPDDICKASQDVSSLWRSTWLRLK